MINQVYVGLPAEAAGHDTKSVEAFYREHGEPNVFERIAAFVGSVYSERKAAAEARARAREVAAAQRPRPVVRAARPKRSVRPVRPVRVAHA